MSGALAELLRFWRSLTAQLMELSISLLFCGQTRRLMDCLKAGAVSLIGNRTKLQMSVLKVSAEFLMLLCCPENFAHKSEKLFLSFFWIMLVYIE